MYPEPLYPMPSTPSADGAFYAIVLIALFMAAVAYLRRRRLSTYAHGTAAFCSNPELRKWSMFGKQGLVIGRSLKGQLLRLPRYCHTLLIGGTGSGKGVGLIVPNLLTYRQGSVVAFDPKAELARITGKVREQYGRVVVLAPFANGSRWNPLDAIPKDDPLLHDKSRAVAHSIVAPNAKAHEPHWDQRAAQVVTACVTLVVCHY